MLVMAETWSGETSEKTLSSFPTHSHVVCIISSESTHTCSPGCWQARGQFVEIFFRSVLITERWFATAIFLISPDLFSPKDANATASIYTTLLIATALLCESKYKWDYATHNMSYAATYKWGGKIHKSFSFSSSHTPFRLSQKKNQWQKIRLLPLCTGSDHFDMLICSFQTAGICSCINSNNFLLKHKHVKMGVSPSIIERLEYEQVQLLEPDNKKKSVYCLISDTFQKTQYLFTHTQAAFVFIWVSLC